MTSPLVLISTNAACLPDHTDAGREDHRFWEQTWRFNARVAHSWRAHKEGLRHIAVSEMEDMVVSAGKGVPAGREGDVLRVWDLATCRAGSCKCKSLSVSEHAHLAWCQTITSYWGRKHSAPPQSMGLQEVFCANDSAGCAAGVQCAGHEGAVVSLCMLPGPQRLIASCDSSGACRVWSGITGVGLSCFAEPGNLGAQATHSSSAWGRQPRSGKSSSHCTLHALRMTCLPISPSDSVFLVYSGVIFPAKQAHPHVRSVYLVAGRISPALRISSAEVQQSSSVPPAPAFEAPAGEQRLAHGDAGASAGSDSAPLSTAAPQAVHTRSYSAYTYAAPAQRGCTECLVAGTAGGRLRWLDLETSCPLVDVYCHPISRWQVVTLVQPRNLLLICHSNILGSCMAWYLVVSIGRTLLMHHILRA